MENRRYGCLPKHLFDERGLLVLSKAALLSFLKLLVYDCDVVLDAYEADTRIVPKGPKADQK
jgi:hypothetical protein